MRSNVGPERRPARCGQPARIDAALRCDTFTCRQACRRRACPRTGRPNLSKCSACLRRLGIVRHASVHDLHVEPPVLRFGRSHAAQWLRRPRRVRIWSASLLHFLFLCPDRVSASSLGAGFRPSGQPAVSPNADRAGPGLRAHCGVPLSLAHVAGLVALRQTFVRRCHRWRFDASLRGRTAGPGGVSTFQSRRYAPAPPPAPPPLARHSCREHAQLRSPGRR